MTMPFTIKEFFSVFIAYNAAIWPAQIIAYILGMVAVSALFMERPLSSRLILAILALMWAWNGIGYHFLFFSRINPAAIVFAGLFVLQALLLAACAVAGPGVWFRMGRDFRSLVGYAVIVNAMLIYPMQSIDAGHGLMAGPMFGVTPCPTTIFTIGMLMLARGRWVLWLSVIPFLWSLIGLAAAVQLGMSEDLGLPIAGVALVLMIAAEMFRVLYNRGTFATSIGNSETL